MLNLLQGVAEVEKAIRVALGETEPDGAPSSDEPPPADDVFGDAA